MISDSNPDHDSLLQICRAAQIINAGGVVVFPAKCLYGLAADALNPVAVERVFAIKKRPLNNPLLVLIDEVSWLESIVKKIPGDANLLMKAFWPGNLTIVFEARSNLPEALTAGTGKVGVRIPGHPVARQLVRECGRPITGTSANISGHEGCMDSSMLEPDILNSVDMILEGGRLKGGKGSTVLDVTVSPSRILREGEISEHDILEFIFKSQ
ncbi:conserved hypothetical protein [Desulfamplus magnetovallimortis]|uniref:L-threonylcarbamoyladenylate synthase n=1 Tax=Desulfamplus magnetovallimortis TaxID=1246637 RepID=A0A1W1H5G4_9BACT|nr:L-threonylcarbamoyladenylate synthase [Desulfamplus magnetovallimortis]SLM27684.1 conserved hypothetical protein [Desulfamplus magnetovallimortis]